MTREGRDANVPPMRRLLVPALACAALALPAAGPAARRVVAPSAVPGGASVR